jgi:hypothetical protein
MVITSERDTDGEVHLIADTGVEKVDLSSEEIQDQIEDIATVEYETEENEDDVEIDIESVLDEDGQINKEKLREQVFRR